MERNVNNVMETETISKNGINLSAKEADVKLKYLMRNYKILISVIATIFVGSCVFFACKKDNDNNNNNSNNAIQLSVPTGVQAIKNGSTIVISWDAVANATEYFVYRSNSYDGAYTSLTSVSGTNTIDAMPIDGDNYYKVKASNGSTTSDYSNFAYCQHSSGGGGGGGLSAPTGVNATQSGTNIIVSWNSVSDATYYILYYATTPSAPTNYLNQQISNTSISLNVNEDGGYYFWVKAYNSTTESDYSSSAYCYYSSGGGGGGTTAPNAPTGVTATQSGTSVYVTWNSISGATGYKVYYSNSANGTYYQSSTSPSGTSWSDNAPYEGANYYKIKAFNSAGESDFSSYAYCNYTSGGGGGGAPSAPTGVTASRSPRSDENVTITWNAVSGATSYKIYYSMSASGSYTQHGSATGTSAQRYFHNDLTSYWKVSAVNSSGEESALSSYGTALGWQSGGGGGTTKLATPTGLEAYSGGSFVQISFYEVSLAYSYELYRATSATGTYSKITASGGTSGGKYILTDSSPRTGTSYYKVKAIPLSSMTNLTASDLSSYVSVTR